MNTVTPNIPSYAQSLDGETGSGHSNGYMSLHKPGHRVENQAAEQREPVYPTPVKWEKGNEGSAAGGGDKGLGIYIHSLPRQSRKMAATLTLAAHQAISLHASQALSREESIHPPLQVLPYNKVAGMGKPPTVGTHDNSPVERWHRDDGGAGMHPVLRSRATIQAAIAGAT